LISRKKTNWNKTWNFIYRVKASVEKYFLEFVIGRILQRAAGVLYGLFTTRNKHRIETAFDDRELVNR